MTTVRVLIACLHLQRHMNRYRGLFERHNIYFEMPHIDQRLSEAELVEIIDRFHLDARLLPVLGEPLD